MTNISILDTGFNDANRDGTAQSGSNINNLSTYIANSGTAVTIKCSGINMKSGANIADEPNPNSNEPARIHHTSFSNRVFDVKYKVNVTDSSQTSALKELAVFERTSGIKLLFADTTSDTLKTIFEILGRTDTKFHGTADEVSNRSKEVTDGIPVIVGRVRGFTIDQKPESRKIQITGKITFEEELVVSA